MSDADSDLPQSERPLMSFAEFMESVHPGKIVRITDLVTPEQGSPLSRLHLADLQLHCSNDSCNGLRFFRCELDANLRPEDGKHLFLQYSCSNCHQTTKTFAVYIVSDRIFGATGRAVKIGEYPPFGPATPARLISLIGPDRDLFLRGRRSEIQGLGIGAFGYYRRVVERQKNRILDRFIDVASKLNAGPEIIADLQAAKTETQFGKAVGSIKHAMPQALLINGHNPLTLLHSALSKGLHDESDDDCLELASSIRVVLVELAERLSLVLKDEAELQGAIAKLLSV